MPCTSGKAAACASRRPSSILASGPSSSVCVKSTATLVDTGFLVALFNDGDSHHASARKMLGELAGLRLYTVWEVLTEAGHLLDDVGRLNLMRWAAAGRLTVLGSEPASLGEKTASLVATRPIASISSPVAIDLVT